VCHHFNKNRIIPRGVIRLYHFIKGFKLFNYFLDKVFTGPREKRGVIFRTLHAISFEGGLLIFTMPIIAYFLKVDWITAFMMDFSLTVMVTVYTFIFNWVYDHARLLFIKRE
jgi:uncharacterized membrane protein